MSGGLNNESTAVRGRYTNPKEVISVATDVTSGWVTVANVKTISFESLLLYLDYTINDSEGVEFRLQATIGDTDYDYPTLLIANSGNLVYSESYILEDEDKSIAWEMFLTPAGSTKVQVRAATVGATPATINSLKYSVKS